MKRIQGKTYSLSKYHLLAEDESWNFTWQLSEPGRMFKVLNISWDYRLSLYPGAGNHFEFVNIWDCPVHVQLIAGDGIVSQIHSSFQENLMSEAIIPLEDFNGRRIYIYKPTQLFYNHWFVSNSLALRVDAYSGDLVNKYQLRWLMSMEIEYV